MAGPPFERVAILGVGLIGGSVGLGLRRRRLARTVIGVTRSAAGRERLLELGVVDEAVTDLAVAVREADLVIAGGPVGVTAKCLLGAAEHAPAGAILTDVASTKHAVVAEVAAGLAASGLPVEFVGGHPLAGDHRSGPEAARGDLFEGRTAVVTPTADNSSAAIQRVSELWMGLGAKVIRMSAAEHDQLVARTSHLPHVVAAALAAATPPDALPLVGAGWSDTTRIAAGDAALWRDILVANSNHVLAGLDDFRTQLSALEAAIRAQDAARIESLLKEGKSRRDALGS